MTSFDTGVPAALGFGCAPIMGRVGRTQALNAMAEAHALGVAHFDVARSYGFGRAEAVVGDFVAGRRDRVSITSKFGVVPPELSMRMRLLIPAARSASRVFPQLRSRLKRRSGQLLAETRFDAGYAARCLETSLRELRSDYIDTYLLHEPQADRLADADRLVRFLQDAVGAGKIRRWGLACRSPADHVWATTYGGSVLQYEGNICTVADAMAPVPDGQRRFITRPFAGGVDALEAAQRAWSGELARAWAAARDRGASIGDVSLSLAGRLAGPAGVVVCSMFTSGHIRRNVDAIRVWHDDALMRDVLDALMAGSWLPAAPGVSLETA